jgi:hypothetical protein
VSGYYNYGGLPSIGNERIWCAPCGEYTIHKWGNCIHCATPMPKPSYRKVQPMRQVKKSTVPKRLTDPMTGLERKS